MPGQVMTEGPWLINSSTQNPDPKSSKPGKEPVTPELEQAASRARFGLPTPDTTPEALRGVTGERRHYVLAHSIGRRNEGPVTPSISSRASPIEDDEDSRGRVSSQGSTRDVEASREPSPVSAQFLHLDVEESESRISIVKSVLESVLSFLNLAKQHRSRADDARVRDTIALVKALPTIRRTRVGNVTRTLTVHQYGQFLRALKNSEDGELRSKVDSLRFDYTRAKKRLEIRMPTSMHGLVEDFIRRRTFRWNDILEESRDARISSAAKTILPASTADVRFPFRNGPSDKKSPDWQIKHMACERQCTRPTLVIEVGWSQSKKDLEAKAEAYIRRSKGEVRTVVAIYMHGAYLAELKNEKRFERMYLSNEEGVVESRTYGTDERNITGEASILIWRRKVQRDGTVKAECHQDEVFRGKNGEPIDGVSLRPLMQDFICEGIASSAAGRFKAPELEITAEDFCTYINNILLVYRQERVEEIIEKVEEDREKNRREDESQQTTSRGKQTRTRASSSSTSTHKADEGRIMSYGRLVSARLRRQKL
ncbi:hypothetical protein F4808DRAFT_470998 [Astrocystis sublimbata]|nr:hypothetical protein F4808DRAFT_470998 [Astrocystis sublimbata]